MNNSQKEKKSQKITGGQAVVKSLKAEKVEHMFGLIGSATIEVFDALYEEKKIKFIGVRDEKTGAHMADGYARASGQPGVMLAGQNGPGATNLVTGIAQAAAAFSPLVSIAGAIPTNDTVQDAFQGIDQQSLFKPITKKTWTVTETERIPEMFREAFHIAMKPRRGPVHINLPRNILSQSTKFKNFQHSQTNKSHKISSAKTNIIKKAAKMISSATQPVIIAGGGIKNTNGHTKVLELAKILNTPVVTSAGHGDAIPFSFSLNAGQMGPRGNPVASRLVKEADVILALGTRLGFNSTFYSYENINKKAKIIQVEIEPTMLGRYFPVSIKICADATTVAEQLCNEINNIKKRKKVDTWTKRFINERSSYLKKRDSNAASETFPIQPSALFKELRNVLPKNSAITLDAGTLCLQATDALNYYESPSLFTPLDSGLLFFCILIHELLMSIIYHYV